MKILTFKECFIYILTLSLASSFFLITVTLFNNVYSFDISNQEERGVFVLREKGAVSSATSLIPLYFTHVLKMVKGVKEVSPEAVALCYVKGEPVIVRGVNPKIFYSVVTVKGVKLNQSDVFSAVLGLDLAERLRVGTGEELLVFSGLNDKFVELKIKGFFSSRSPFKDEILVPLNIGQWLRGTNYGFVSLLRVKIEEKVINKEFLFREVTETYSVKVSLRMKNNSSLVQGATVLIFDPLGNFYSKKVTGAEGKTSFKLPIGTYSLYVVLHNRTTTEPFKFNVSRNEELTFILPSNLTGKPPKKRIEPSAGKPEEIKAYSSVFRGVKWQVSSVTLKSGDVKGFLEEKIGFTDAFLWLLASLTFLFSMLTVNQASSSLIKNIVQTIHVLRALGASKKYVLKKLLSELVIVSLLSGFGGCLLGTFITFFFFRNLLVFSHTLTFSITPWIEGAVLFLTVSLGTLNSYLLVLNELKKQGEIGFMK